MRSPAPATLLSPVSIGSPCAHKLQDDRVVSYFLGLVPIRTLPLSEVLYLRLATRREAFPVYLLFNWTSFLSHRRSIRPVYVLQTKGRRRIFLKLESGIHFKLRQAIGKASEPQPRPIRKRRA